MKIPEDQSNHISFSYIKMMRLRTDLVSPHMSNLPLKPKEHPHTKNMLPPTCHQSSNEDLVDSHDQAFEHRLRQQEQANHQLQDQGHLCLETYGVVDDVNSLNASLGHLASQAGDPTISCPSISRAKAIPPTSETTLTNVSKSKKSLNKTQTSTQTYPFLFESNNDVIRTLSNHSRNPQKLCCSQGRGCGSMPEQSFRNENSRKSESSNSVGGRCGSKASGQWWPSGRLFGVLALVSCVLCLVDFGEARPSSSRERYRKLQADTVKYLAQFGYLSGPSQETQDLLNHEDLTRAIKSLQKIGNIPQTGVIDSRTELLMRKPRCGNTDDFMQEDRYQHRRGYRDGIARYRRGYSYRDGGKSRRKRYTLATSKWPHTNLTFRFVNYTPDMPKAKTRQIIGDALKLWSDATPLSFTEVLNSRADIMIQFASRYHSDGYPFDGTGMVLAHAFFPGPNKGGDTHFDEDENWSVNSTGGIDLFMVAAHEFGHALGLAHSGDPEALMYPWYMGFQSFRLPNDDREGITRLYGEGIRDRKFPDRTKVSLIPNVPDRDPVYVEPAVPTAGQDRDEGPPDPCNSKIDALTVIRTEIFLFIGKWFWRLGAQKLINQPIEIHEFWYGFPQTVTKIDAVFERPDNRIVFFSGDRFWVFNANNLQRNFPKEGKPITEFNIPIDVKKIDAAFIWSFNKRTYLVSGDMYWKMNENNTFVEYDYPRDMRIWKDVPVPLDAAFRDNAGKTIFFQGLDYWEFYDMKMRIRKGYPRRISKYWSQCPENLEQESKTEVKTKLLDDEHKSKAALSDKKEKKGNGCALMNVNVILMTLLLFSHYT